MCKFFKNTNTLFNPAKYPAIKNWKRDKEERPA